MDELKVVLGKDENLGDYIGAAVKATIKHIHWAEGIFRGLYCLNWGSRHYYLSAKAQPF